MKIVLAISALIAASTEAAPAIVWSNGNKAAAEHTSERVEINDVIASAFESRGKEGSRLLNSSPSLDSVIFLVGRDEDGGEALTRLASSGALPTVAKKYEEADFVHHHARGVESGHKLAKDAVRARGESAEQVMEASLEEFNRKLTSENIEAASKSKRSRALAKARTLIVTVSAEESEKLDAAVGLALENVNNVVLTAVRSAEEVKHERKLTDKSRTAAMQSAAKMSSRRRLEDEQQEANDDANNQNNNNYAYDEDMEGVYYVAITPNILSGILFILFFIFVAHLGLSCMNMIQGQDVYTDKYPSIGREA